MKDDTIKTDRKRAEIAYSHLILNPREQSQIEHNIAHIEMAIRSARRDERIRVARLFEAHVMGVSIAAAIRSLPDVEVPRHG